MSEEQQDQIAEQISVPSARPEKSREPSIKATAKMIAKALGETQVESVAYVVRMLGQAQAMALLERAQEIEANGGLLVSDGSRRKTAGGVYLFVAYTQGKPQPGKDLKKWLARARSMHADSAQNRPRSEILPPLCWDKRITVIEAIGKEIGSIETVKVMVIGRVSKYQNFGDYVVGVIEQNSEKRPSLPKGLPVPPVLKTKYLVTIGAKQWRKVASTLTDPQDALIIDGFPHLDTKTGAIAVVANSVTSKKQMAAKREQQKAKSAAAIQADPQG